MDGEIPQNTVRTLVHTVSRAGLFPLFEVLHKNRNVLRIEHERDGGNFKVRIYFAIMDLPLKIAVAAADIEQAVAEANRTPHTRS